MTTTPSSPFEQLPHAAAWPAHVPHTLEVPDESLWAAFSARADRAPQEVGLHFLGRDHTWQALRETALHLAGALQAVNVQAGDRVLLFMQNCPQFVVAFHAVLNLGAVVVPINPMNKADELEHYLQDTGASVAITSSDIAAELTQAATALGTSIVLKHVAVFDLADALPEVLSPELPALWKDWLTVRHALPSWSGGMVHRWLDWIGQARTPVAPQTHGDDLALLPYTSGTTGAAKGCMHTHRTLMHNVLAAGPWLDMRSGDSVLIAVPMFHITGLVMGMLASVRHGCRLVLLPRWDRCTAAQAIERFRITHWPNIPTMVIDLLGGSDLDRYDLRSLRYIGGGGANMPDAVAARLHEVFGLNYVEGYGLTETSAPTHINPMHAPRRHCLGIPHIGTRATVVDPATLEPMAVGEVGEILVHGPQVFKGYWQQPKATQDAFVELDGITYFRTGDLGRRDADGFYYLADRLKRMINASGFKVWPTEVEALLHRHPAVREVCVIATQDPYRGESVKAFVVLRDEFVHQITPEELIAWSKEHMAAYKYPRVVEFITELPKTASGKVLWRRLQENERAQQPGTQS